MATKTGKIGSMGFYIGRDGDKFKAEIKINGVTETEEFDSFSEANQWVEDRQKQENVEIENQRD